MVKNTIVLVPFPFDDFSSSKIRPALCLTNPIGRFEQVVIAFISSQLPDDILETDIVLRTASYDFAGTGLRTDSVIRVHKMVTIPKSIIKRELGSINENVQQQLFHCLNFLFK